MHVIDYLSVHLLAVFPFLLLAVVNVTDAGLVSKETITPLENPALQLCMRVLACVFLSVCVCLCFSACVHLYLVEVTFIQAHGKRRKSEIIIIPKSSTKLHDSNCNTQAEPIGNLK